MPGKLKLIGIVAAGAAMAVVLFGLTEPQQAGAAEDQHTAPLSFEVASIRPSGEIPRGTPLDRMEVSPGGRWTASAISVGRLIQIACDVKYFQISGGPSWLNTERYDITAKADMPSISPEQLKVLIQSLLAERFNLKFHREIKEMKVYVMLVGKNGHKLQKSEIQSDTQGGRAGSFRLSREDFLGQAVEISSLASFLTSLLDRPVVDKTGITGYYDIHVPFSSDQRMLLRGWVDTRAASDGSMLPADPAGTDIFRDIEKHLGLKLDPQNSPVELLVVDHLEKAVIQ